MSWEDLNKWYYMKKPKDSSIKFICQKQYAYKSKKRTIK